MKIQTIKPKDGETYIIENYDGELTVNLDLSKPLKSLTLQFPDNPPRASKIRIHASQDLKSITAVGSFSEPFTTLKSGNIGFVWCPVSTYLVTGQNEIKSVKSKFPWVKIIGTILLLVAALSIVLYLNFHH